MEGKGAAPALLHTRWLLLVFSLFPIFLMFLCLVKTSLQQGLSTQLGATGQSEHFSGTERRSWAGPTILELGRLHKGVHQAWGWKLH